MHVKTDDGKTAASQQVQPETPGEAQPKQLHWRERLRLCVKNAIPAAWKTALWILQITIPLSFLVMVMKATGMLPVVARLFQPLFGLVGLPGEAAIVYVTSCLLNIYGAVAVIGTLGLAGRAVTILAIMCLISHNLVVECAVQKKTGSSAWRMMFLRLGTSFVAGFAFSHLLPADLPGQVNSSLHQVVTGGFRAEFGSWLPSIVRLCAKVITIVTALTILERILHEFGVTERLSRVMKYPLLLLGLPSQTGFLWIVANVLGLAYGGGVMVDNVSRGLLSEADADTLNHHTAISHSLLEDTCLFVAIGVSVWWITLPRIFLAGIVVWLKRLGERMGGERRTTNGKLQEHPTR